MRGKIPQTIVTDEQQSMTKALSDLKEEYDYDYLHLLDEFHKLQSMKRKMTSLQIERKTRVELLGAYSKLIKQ